MHRHAAEQDEVSDLGAGGEQHEPAQQRHQRGHREIGLQQDEQRHAARAPRGTAATPFLNSRTCSPFLAASMAHQITTTSRASSEGWKLTGPRWTQRRAPLIDGRDVAGEGQQRDEEQDDGDEQQRPGQRRAGGSSPAREASSRSTPPRSAPVSWRERRSRCPTFSPSHGRRGWRRRRWWRCRRPRGSRSPRPAAGSPSAARPDAGPAGWLTSPPRAARNCSPRSS